MCFCGSVFFCLSTGDVCFMAFCFFLRVSIAVFIMDATSDSQCGDNRGEDRGTENSNDRMKFKNMRKA